MQNLLPKLFLPENEHIFLLKAGQRKVVLSGLLVLLIAAGVFTEQIFLWLDHFFIGLFSTLGLYEVLQQSQAEVSSQLTMRSWPAMLSYGLMYTVLSFLTLHVYFNRLWKTKIAMSFYLGIFLICSLLIITGKLTPNGNWAYMLCRRLIEMVVSPLPVILLAAALSTFRAKQQNPA
ncbi:MAG TPA: hypothetical protein VK927_09425 [Adhaeribacter sp.]|nr:hypothetical protein [Adhaeribacter sp.]